MAVQLPKRLFNVDEYYRMAEAGVLSPGERVELIEGEIIEMAAIGSRHAACVKRLTAALVPALAGRAIVGVQDPVRLSHMSEPQPDLAVLKPRADHYAERHPAPEDVYLLIEVAETTSAIDRGVKARLYARYGIPEYWLVDVGPGAIELRRRPAGAAYGDVHVARRGERIAPLAFPDVELRVEDVVG
jgi:Uma2 family endonuclease